MTTELYDGAPVPVREDLVAAHRQVIEGWASPGDWWSAAERLAIVDEVRAARAADELPPWVRPSTVDGLVDPDHVLPPAAVDVVWRLTNHSATLTADWHQEMIAEGLSHEEYVELVAVVATANSLEVFAEALGVASVPLPVPTEGDPRRRPTEPTEVSTHWVPTVDTGGANVTKALTAVPAAVEAWQTLSRAQYMPIDAVRGDLAFSRGALDRMQVELLAARTSLLNECFY